MLQAVEWLQVKMGGRQAVADAMGISYDALRKATGPGRTPSKRLALAVAYVAGVDVEKVLSGEWPGSVCPMCGHATDQRHRR